MADLLQSWSCALWCGVAEKLLRERLAVEPPLTELQKDVIRSCVTKVVARDHYNKEQGERVLALLE